MSLREVRDVRQEPGESPRRWFVGEDFDLIVWEGVGAGGEAAVRRFQLAYDKRGRERLVDWSRGGRSSHHRVDTGEVQPLQFKGTPILLPEPTPPPDDLAARFEDASRELEPALRNTVLRVLADLSADPGDDRDHGNGSLEA